MGLEIGKEYASPNTDFLSKKVMSIDYVIYLGEHPYDGRHMFALKPAGCVHCPKNGAFLDNLEEVL